MNLERIKIYLKEHKYILIIFFLALLTRLLFLGSSLWHNDAVDFVESAVHLAVRGEYLSAHSPDYPIWGVMLSAAEKLTLLISGNVSPIFIPNLITALLGILTIIILFYLVRNLTGKNDKIAFISCLVLIFNPAFWIFNEFALSDTAAVFFVILALFLFDSYLRKAKIELLLLSSLFLTLAGLARITNVFFIIILMFLFFIFHQQTKIKITFQKVILIGAIMVILPIVLNLVVYGLIHDWNAQKFISISRRVTPFLSDFLNTFNIFWLTSLPLFFLFYFIGIISTFFKKQWYLFTYLFLPTVVYYYYFSGWWQNGYFDIDRYMVILSPFIAMGAALGIYGTYSYFRTKKRMAYYIFNVFMCLIFISHFYLIVISLFSQSLCENMYKVNFLNNIFFPGAYCEINHFHNSQDPKLDIFTTLNDELPQDAIVVVGSSDWAYPRFFGNNFGLGQREYYLFEDSDIENIDLLKSLILNNPVIFVPLYKKNSSITIGFINQIVDLIKEQNWEYEFLQFSGDVAAYKIINLNYK